MRVRVNEPWRNQSACCVDDTKAVVSCSDLRGWADRKDVPTSNRDSAIGDAIKSRKLISPGGAPGCLTGDQLCCVHHEEVDLF